MELLYNIIQNFIWYNIDVKKMHTLYVIIVNKKKVL